MVSAGRIVLGVVVLSFLVTAAVFGQMILDDAAQFDGRDDHRDGPTHPSNPGIDGQSTNREEPDYSCTFHDDIPDVEETDRQIVAEGRPLARHDGHVEGLLHENANDIREAHGEDRLPCDRSLVMIARNHSEDMAERDFFDHVNPDGQTPGDRIREAGYSCEVAGENLHMTWYQRRVDTTIRHSDRRYRVLETPEELARSGMNNGLFESPPHRRAMLDGIWSVMGIGVYVTDENQVYVTQLFCVR